MDLNGAAARLAKEKGCKIAVDTDTHIRGHLDYMRFGVGTARRAWLGPEDIVNCWLLDRAREFFE
jgi:DNA polymerase (family 10)